MGERGRVLIANRGEIAIRIAKAAAGLALESVAVYSPVDAQCLHTHYGTEARQIGSGSDASTDAVGAYLDVDALLHTALDTGCDRVHPGYGFLAESAVFAERCAVAGLTFIGPEPETLRLFGDKLRAREFAKSLGIPVVPGSAGPLGSPEEALTLAERLGYPLMVKATAGGGGRGIRKVTRPDEISEAFDRCRSEALAAFGDGSLFFERMIPRPRHIEVQILADAFGAVVHLHERDCSVQRRNQKVVEVAPAPGLDARIRDRILADGVALAAAAGYVNAGTFEFLVSPETGEHFFIEANPRIQVEHTVTEQVTGVDLVEAQILVASGASLDSLGLGDQAAVGAPRGYAVQARVVATGTGTITAYKEPSGPGVRVDACGYPGYTPPAQFDPLFAKVICQSATAGTYESALERTARALDEFLVLGLPTNLPELQAILTHPTIRAGEARTTWLEEEADLPARRDPGSGCNRLVAFLERHASPSATSDGAPAAPPRLTPGEGQHAVRCPMDGVLVGFHVTVGDSVVAGDAIAVVSAMKMETVVAAPRSGVVASLAPLQRGSPVSTDQAIAVIDADGSGPDASRHQSDADGSWNEVLGKVHTLQQLAHQRLAAGSDDPGVVRQRQRGKLTCRERIALLLDEGSFHEIGSVAGFASYDDEGEMTAFTPSNHVGGWGTVEGRETVVCADDFTSRGGHADGSIATKSRYLDELSLQLQVPSVRMLDGSSGGGSVAAMVPEQVTKGASSAQESRGAITAGRPRVTGSGGSFLPGHLGSTMYAKQLATVPVVNMLLGSVVGIGAAKAVLGHFSVMVRDIAQLFVAGPPVVRHAMGYDISKEELGGWQVHCRNGSVDNLAESEEEAAELVRHFLAYLPPSVYEAPPTLPSRSADPPERRAEELLTLIPRRRTTTFDIRQAISVMADEGSFFEVGPLWGTDQITGFVRFDGRPLGVIASDSRHPNGGAMTAAGCDKLIRHIDLCDLFHLPILNLVDSPGFAVGLEHETAGTIRSGGRWMVAFAQAGVPICTVVLRRSFGVAGNNFATPRAEASLRVAWPAADVGGIPPEGGIEAAYRRQLAEAADPEALRAELNARIESVRGPLGPLSKFQLEEMIDPRDTRRIVCEWARIAHRVASQPARLTPRPIQYRP